MEVTSIFDPVKVKAAVEVAPSGADNAAAKGEDSFAALLHECSSAPEGRVGAETAVSDNAASEESEPIAAIQAIIPSVNAQVLLDGAAEVITPATDNAVAVQAAPVRGEESAVSNGLSAAAIASPEAEARSGADDVDNGGKTAVSGLIVSNGAVKDAGSAESGPVITLDAPSADAEARAEGTKTDLSAGVSIADSGAIERADGDDANEAARESMDDEAAEEVSAPVVAATSYAPLIAASAYAETAGMGAGTGKGEGVVEPSRGVAEGRPESGPSVEGGAAEGSEAGNATGAASQAALNGDDAADKGYDYSAINGTLDDTVETAAVTDAVARVESKEAEATLPSVSVANDPVAETITNPGVVKPAKGGDGRSRTAETHGAVRTAPEAASVEAIGAAEDATAPAAAVFENDDAVIKTAAKASTTANGAEAVKERGEGAIPATDGADNERTSRYNGVTAHKEAGRDAVFGVNPDAHGVSEVAGEEGREPQVASTGSVDTVKGANDLITPGRLAVSADNGANAAAGATRVQAAAAHEPAPVFELLEDGVKLSVLKGGKEVTVTLHPEELGRLKVSVSETRDAVSAKIIVENAAVKEMLDAGSYRLRELFTRHGLNLDRCSVEVGGFGASFGGNGTADGAAGGKGAWQQTGAGFGPAGEGAGREHGRGHYARQSGNGGVPAGVLGGQRAGGAAGGLDIFA